MARNRWVGFHNGDDWSLEQQKAFAGYGIEVSPVIQLHQILALPLLAASTGTIAIALRSAATMMQRFTTLKILELPGDPVVQEIHLMWSSVHTHDSAHQWFRNLIIEVSRSPLV
jgi:DNA-binding transcriptional LysR family regulator